MSGLSKDSFIIDINEPTVINNTTWTLMFRSRQDKEHRKVCPFQSSHLLEPSRYITHLIKCKSPKRVNYVQCKFNSTHYYLKNQINNHQLQCDSKKFQQKYSPNEREENQLQPNISTKQGKQTQNREQVKLQEYEQKDSNGELLSYGLSECSSCMAYIEKIHNKLTQKNPKLVKYIKRYQIIRHEDGNSQQKIPLQKKSKKVKKQHIN